MNFKVNLGLKWAKVIVRLEVVVGVKVKVKVEVRVEFGNNGLPMDGLLSNPLSSHNPNKSHSDRGISSDHDTKFK